jgi:hypothetical protein
MAHDRSLISTAGNVLQEEGEFHQAKASGLAVDADDLLG